MPGRTWQATQATSRCEDFIQLSYEGGDGMATGIERRLTRDRGSHSAKREDTGDESQGDGRFRFPAHAPHETATLGTAS